MTYDDGLAHRVREALASRPGVAEKEMFGGLGFDDALSEPHARPFDFTGREMRGWVYVDPSGLSSDAALEEWVDRTVGFVETLPAK